MSDTTPTGTPLHLKADGKVNTNMQTLVAIISATAILVGGLVSLKADVGAAAKDAGEARAMVEDIRDNLYRLRLQLGASDSTVYGTATRKVQP